MKELRIKISDEDYAKLTKIAERDAEEYGNTKKEMFRRNLYYAIECFLQNSSAYYGLEED